MERDVVADYVNWAKKHFNSHAHVERDISRLDVAYDDFISTHTLTWSVTGAQVDKDKLVYISTHTLTWSVTNGLLKHYTMNRFQLTRSRGA